MRSRKSLSGFVAGMFLFASIVCFESFPMGYSLVQSKDENAIRTLVGRLFELYQQKDLEGLLLLWSEKSPFLAQNKLSLERDFTTNEKIDLKGFEIRKMRIEGEEATLRVAAILAAIRAKSE